MEYNDQLYSSTHMGSKQLMALSGICHPEMKAKSPTSPAGAQAGTEADNHAYDLKGIVVHYGSGMHHGHYWSLSRTYGPNPKWIEYDD